MADQSLGSRHTFPADPVQDLEDVEDLVGMHAPLHPVLLEFPQPPPSPAHPDRTNHVTANTRLTRDYA
ncbi:hypothetical protein DPMN_168601 [Dreissena polymorpha]|uniref:Uncharacterized protein n=1 Tax=Dreissena polymorpha TaxID=45954 RepID=A0A9D4IZS1_DREPO|nr:hypothetical protein DPMN_168601 [Dreissena polymorpha]